MNIYYVLDENRIPVPISSVVAWDEFMQSDERIVAKTIMDTDEVVSTVFLGLDHGYGTGPSLFFETLILGGPHDGYMVRYPTWELAEVGHHEAVSKILKGELL